MEPQHNQQHQQASSADQSAKPARKRPNRKQILGGLGIAGVIVLIFATIYWIHEQKFVYTDNAQISAPLINLTALTPGDLKAVYVNQGDWLYPNEIVARVGDDMIRTQVAGVAVTVKQDLGANYTPGEPVVTMVQPDQLKVVAQVQEDKGLQYLYAGQDVNFTVDAFPGRAYHGTVESVSDTSHNGDVVFNISDKRQEQNFDVKIAFDTTAYPELQNGMSAKVWIVK
ncbi:MAG TPA: HlyD family secretion protein [Candidatus Peribacteraceae bacterium]|nr:HlyD family secretion protein [Candidatus Peribacteraceae bacterium]